MFQFFLVLLVAVPIALLIAGVAGLTIAKRALRPIERMATKAEGITAKNLSDRLEIKNPDDELGQLSSVINHLLDRLQQSFEQLQHFTADAAHELRTPLAALRTIGEVALEDAHGEHAYKEALSSILEETSRLSETIDALLLLARAEATQAGEESEACSVKAIVSEVLGLLEVLSEEKELTILQEGEASTNITVRSDRGLLRTALMNILYNAIKFSPERGVIRVQYRRSESRPHFVEVSVKDEGPGIASGEHQRVFERFFTSNARDTALHSGTGLGLSVSKLVIERIGGFISFEEETMAGALCRVELPEASGRIS